MGWQVRDLEVAFRRYHVVGWHRAGCFPRGRSGRAAGRHATVTDSHTARPQRAGAGDRVVGGVSH